MATIRGDGRPANRTIVFRGFVDESPRLAFCSDARSNKVQELARSPWSELCWYFPVTHEQFRIAGPTVVAGENADQVLLEARRTLWSQLAEAVRVSFTWPAPGNHATAACRFRPFIPTRKHPSLISAC